jgi:hypothetical protein
MTTPLAYIDPGTGMLVWQSVTAGVIGAAFCLRRFFGKLFRRGGPQRNS